MYTLLYPPWEASREVYTLLYTTRVCRRGIPPGYIPYPTTLGILPYPLHTVPCCTHDVRDEGWCSDEALGSTFEIIREMRRRERPSLPKV